MFPKSTCNSQKGRKPRETRITITKHIVIEVAKVGCGRRGAWQLRGQMLVVVMVYLPIKKVYYIYYIHNMLVMLQTWRLRLLLLDHFLFYFFRTSPFWFMAH